MFQLATVPLHLTNAYIPIATFCQMSAEQMGIDIRATTK